MILNWLYLRVFLFDNCSSHTPLILRLNSQSRLSVSYFWLSSFMFSSNVFMFLFRSISFFKWPHNFKFNFKLFFSSISFKDNTLSFFFNRLFFKKSTPNFRVNLFAPTQLLDLGSLVVSGSGVNSRTPAYTSFLHLSKKRKLKNFFRINSLSTFKLARVSVMPTLGSSTVSLVPVPNPIMPLLEMRYMTLSNVGISHSFKSVRRYFIQGTFCLQSTEPSLVLSRTGDVMKAHSHILSFQNTFLSSSSHFNLTPTLNNNYFVYRIVRFFRLNTSAFTQQRSLLNLIVDNNIETGLKFGSDSFFRKTFFENRELLSSLSWGIYPNGWPQFPTTSLASITDITSSQRLNRLRRLTIIWTNKLNQLSLTPIRRDFFSMNRKKFRYQSRFTKFILKFYRFTVFNLILKNEFNIKLILVRLGLADNMSSADFLINLGVVYVNFVLMRSTSFLIYSGDSINLALHFKFLIYIKWLFLNFRSNYRRFFYYLYKWKTRQRRVFPKTKSFRIPNWVKYHIFFKESLPMYVEADFLSMSFIIITSPLDFRFFNYMSLRLNSVATIRSLNWKSLT